MMLLQTSPVNSDPDLLLHCNGNGLRGVGVVVAAGVFCSRFVQPQETV